MRRMKKRKKGLTNALKEYETNLTYMAIQSMRDVAMIKDAFYSELDHLDEEIYSLQNRNSFISLFTKNSDEKRIEELYKQKVELIGDKKHLDKVIEEKLAGEKGLTKTEIVENLMGDDSNTEESSQDKENENSKLKFLKAL